jgi:hypothetical protein
LLSSQLVQTVRDVQVKQSAAQLMHSLVSESRNSPDAQELLFVGNMSISPFGSMQTPSSHIIQLGEHEEQFPTSGSFY